MNDCNDLMVAAEKEIDDPKDGNLRLAEGKLRQVRQRLAQAWYSDSNKHYVLRLLGWYAFAFLLCVGPLMYYNLLPGLVPKLPSHNINVGILFASFLVGAGGGVFEGLFVLYQVCGRRKFDRAHWVWHVTSPFLGGILGVIVFCAILGGLMATTGSGIAGAENQTNTQASVTAHDTTMAALVLVVAFIAGFKQTTVMRFLDRLAKNIFGEDKEAKS